MTGAYTFKRFDPADGQNRWIIPKGHWTAWNGFVHHGDGMKTPQLFVLIRCPECGEAGMLPHQVDASGNVHPSIQCPGKDCAFHTNPNLLEGWNCGHREDTKD